MGRFNVTNLQPGQYTIAAIDKTLWGTPESHEATLQLLYPNPTHGLLMVQSGAYQITNLLGQTLKKGMSQGQIDVSDLPAGTYVLSINGQTQKFVIQ